MKYGQWKAKWEGVPGKLRGIAQARLHPQIIQWMSNHLYAQFNTSGKHGGGSWDFSSEPKYQSYKTALWGASLGSKPLLTSPRVEVLRPAMARGWAALDGGVRHNVSHPNATSLLRTGGVGPFGEPYPARNPYQMTQAQADELKLLIVRHISSAWRG